MKIEASEYLIGTVAERLKVHPQTLRLYEREGFIRPRRSGGNMRRYARRDIERVAFILHLTRDLGVNLAGVDMILRLRDRIQQLEEIVRRSQESEVRSQE